MICICSIWVHCSVSIFSCLCTYCVIELLLYFFLHWVYFVILFYYHYYYYYYYYYFIIILGRAVTNVLDLNSDLKLIFCTNMSINNCNEYLCPCWCYTYVMCDTFNKFLIIFKNYLKINFCKWLHPQPVKLKQKSRNQENVEKKMLEFSINPVKIYLYT